MYGSADSQIEGATDRGPNVTEMAVFGLRTGLGERLFSAVLFGSRARGDSYPNSDWDLLVIAAGLPDAWLDRYQALKSMLPPEIRGAVAMLGVTPEEFEARVPALYLDIALDGQILYDRSEYAMQRLAALRHTMDKAGLYRERTEAGDRWTWVTPPGPSWSIEWES